MYKRLAVLGLRFLRRFKASAVATLFSLHYQCVSDTITFGLVLLLVI